MIISDKIDILYIYFRNGTVNSISFEDIDFIYMNIEEERFIIYTHIIDEFHSEQLQNANIKIKNYYTYKNAIDKIVAVTKKHGNVTMEHPHPNHIPTYEVGNIFIRDLKPPAIAIQISGKDGYKGWSPEDGNNFIKEILL